MNKLSVLLLTFGAGVTFSQSEELPSPPTQELTQAAQQFLAQLPPKKQTQATYPFTDEERENWHYVPMSRAGIRLDALDEKQQAAAQKLLRHSLSAQGHITAQEVMKLEALLYERSKQSDFRNPGKYTVTLFGQPSGANPWGWRFEGHHLSLNFSIIDDQVTVTTPFFFGTNPAQAAEGPLKGLRPLGEVEDHARELALELHSQGKHVRFSMKSPHEILTGQKRAVQQLAKEGVPYRELDEASKNKLVALVQMVAQKQKPEFLNITQKDLEDAVFGWTGEFERGAQHYFRIQTTTFLIEYANTQNNGNHAHLVWRDFQNDFGRDVLREHLEHGH